MKINVQTGDGEERKQEECCKGDKLSTDVLHAPTETLLPHNIIKAAYFKGCRIILQRTQNPGKNKKTA